MGSDLGRYFGWYIGRSEVRYLVSYEIRTSLVHFSYFVDSFIRLSLYDGCLILRYSTSLLHVSYFADAFFRLSLYDGRLILRYSGTRYDPWDGISDGISDRTSDGLKDAICVKRLFFLTASNRNALSSSSASSSNWASV